MTTHPQTPARDLGSPELSASNLEQVDAAVTGPQPREASGAERFSYGLFALGGIFSYYLVMSYLQKFLTDAGIAAATVGTIFLFAKVWDAINDPVFGVIVDKAQLKGGKYRPWLRIASIAIPVATILLFLMPTDLPGPVKILWATVAYLLWDTAYTMYDAPMYSSATVMTSNARERNGLYARAAFFVYLGGILVAVIVPILYPLVGWAFTGVVMSALCAVAMLWLPILLKERHSSAAQNELSVREILSSLVRNRYLLIFVGAIVLGQMTNFGLSLNIYLAEYVFGSASWMLLLTLASALPVLVVALVAPTIAARWDKYWVLVGTIVVALVLNLVIFLIGYENPWLVIGLIALRSFFDAFGIVTSVMFLADTIEYIHFTTGHRAQGVAFAMKSFMNKLIVALTGALAMFGLQLFGFMSGPDAVQSQHTLDGIWMLCTLMPVVGAVLSLIVLAFYRLRDHDVQVMIRANMGEISQDVARSLFIKRF